MSLKTGNLYKKGGGGPGMFQRKNWKPRSFKLTSESLLYYDYDSGKLKGCIDLTQCTVNNVETMPLDCIKQGYSNASQWRLAISTPERRWYLAADTKEDMDEWATSIRRAIEKYSLEATTRESLDSRNGTYSSGGTSLPCA